MAKVTLIYAAGYSCRQQLVEYSRKLSLKTFSLNAKKTTTSRFAPQSFAFNLIAQLSVSPEQQKLVFPLILPPMLMEIGYEKSSHSGKSKWPSFPVMDPAAIKIMCNNKIRQWGNDPWGHFQPRRMRQNSGRLLLLQRCFPCCIQMLPFWPVPLTSGICCGGVQHKPPTRISEIWRKAS